MALKYKVGDRVKIKSLDWYNENKDIHGDICFDNAVFVGGQSLYCGCELTIRFVAYDSYRVIENDYYWTDEMIEGLVKEETLIERVDDNGLPFNEWLSHKGAFHIPDGYELKDENGNVINTTKIVLEKKKKEYPKTYEECCKVLDITPIRRIGDIGYKRTLLNVFEKLLVCRDAYWKLYGEEKGLGKPWEPDCDYNSPSRYVINCYFGDIIKEKYCGQYNRPLSFPTEEMRDAFKENFGPDIDICKEFL